MLAAAPAAARVRGNVMWGTPHHIYADMWPSWVSRALLKATEGSDLRERALKLKLLNFTAGVFLFLLSICKFHTEVIPEIPIQMWSICWFSSTLNGLLINTHFSCQTLKLVEALIPKPQKIDFSGQFWSYQGASGSHVPSPHEQTQADLWLWELDRSCGPSCGEVTGEAYSRRRISPVESQQHPGDSRWVH